MLVQFEWIINSAVSKLWLEIFHMRGSFAQLKSRKTFSGGVVDKTTKQIFPFTRFGYVYNFTSDAIELFKLSRSARTGVPSTGLFAVWRFFHPSLSFSWNERSVPNKYTTILRFSETFNCLIIELNKKYAF